MPSQALVALKVMIFLFFDLLVGDFLRALVAELADQAFVQNVVAERLRRAVARDQRERKKRDRLVALVHHLVLDREQIFVVDRDGAAEFEALAVVVGQRHRMADAERAGACLRPHRVRCGDLHIGAGGIGPAEFGIERIGAAGRRQQHDRRRLRIDRLAKLDQRQVVDASAFERDRALQAVGCDRDARRRRQGRVAVGGRGGRSLGRLTGRLRRSRLRGCLRRLAGLARLRRRLLLLRELLGLQFLLPRLFLRHGEEKLPGDQHQGRQHDGENGVLIVGHRDAVLPLRPACTRRSAPSKSSAIRANGTLSAARRPIST